MKAQDLSRGVPIHFLWTDSGFKSGWQYGEEARVEIVHVSSLGLVVESDEENLTISSALDTGDGALCPVTIPWASISECEIVRIPI